MDPAAQNSSSHNDDGGGESLIGFGLGTPTDGPSQPPAYTNFSPLFCSSNLTGLPPVAPIALRANTVQAADPTTSFMPNFLDGNLGLPNNGFLMDQQPSFSYATLATPVPIATCQALQGERHQPRFPQSDSVQE